MLCRLLQQHESAQLKQTAKHTAVTIFADVIWQLVRTFQEASIRHSKSVAYPAPCDLSNIPGAIISQQYLSTHTLTTCLVCFTWAHCLPLHLAAANAQSLLCPALQAIHWEVPWQQSLLRLWSPEDMRSWRSV
jgi:hypothetical protein